MCCPALSLGLYLTGFSPVAAWRALKQPSVKMFEDASLAHVKVHRCQQHIKNNLKKESKKLRNAGTGKQRLKKSELLELLPVLLSFLIDSALLFIFFPSSEFGVLRDSPLSRLGNGGGRPARRCQTSSAGSCIGWRPTKNLANQRIASQRACIMTTDKKNKTKV